jgi:hypothetical protein
LFRLTAGKDNNMRRQHTDQEKTFEILGGYLMNNNELNIEYFADQVEIIASNTRFLYEDRFNTRRKLRNIAITELMFFIDQELYYSGYEGFYATSKQVMKWDSEHGYGLEKVLDILEENILRDREEAR